MRPDRPRWPNGPSAFSTQALSGDSSTLAMRPYSTLRSIFAGGRVEPGSTARVACRDAWKLT